MKYFILDSEKRVHEAPDIDTFNSFFSKTENRRVAVSQDQRKKIIVSTIFLGYDHNFNDIGEPILFETMVFKNGNVAEELLYRCTTYDEAIKCHLDACHVSHIKPTL